MTHIDNIPNIFEVGFVHKTSPLANPEFITIGDISAINTRNQKTLQDGNLIGSYIPFYLGPRTPMLYVIQHGFNNVIRQKASDIVYCVIEIQDIIDNHINCIFTDGHALNHITNIYTSDHLTEIDEILDYDILYSKSWNDYPDMKRQKEAELLLKDELPAKYIKYYLVYDEVAKNRLQSFGIPDIKIRISPQSYF